MSQRKGSLLCKLELHGLSKKTVLKISLNPGLNLTTILGTGPRVTTILLLCAHCVVRCIECKLKNQREIEM